VYEGQTAKSEEGSASAGCLQPYASLDAGWGVHFAAIMPEQVSDNGSSTSKADSIEPYLRIQYVHSKHFRAFPEWPDVLSPSSLASSPT
jgi:hypothetical protein